MPLKSKAQLGFMFANYPEMAKEWASKTKDIKNLPEKVTKKDTKKKSGNSGKYSKDVISLAMKKHGK